MRNVIIEVSKKVNSKYEKQGEVAITVPVIEDIIPFMAAKVTGEEDGLPVYDSDEANWIQSAILAYVKAGARNKLQPGTATVKDGLKIPTNWAELCAEGERGGGAALAALREAKTLFTEWISKQGKSEAAQATIVTLFSNKAALQLQSAGNKAKMAAYIEQFAESLTEEQLEKISRPIESVMAACQSGDAEDF